MHKRVTGDSVSLSHLLVKLALGCLASVTVCTTGCRTAAPVPVTVGDVPDMPVRTGRFEQAIEGFRTPVTALVPENYDPGKSYGLVVFLHGTGMTGARMVSKTPVDKIHEAKGHA